MSEVIGVKHDGGKPLAGTVLAGFWPQLRELFRAQLTEHALLSDEEFEYLCDVLDAFFDVSLAIPDRLVKAADLLSDVSTDVYLPDVIDVGTYGARKYDRDNWLHVEGGVERYYEAVGRHVRDVLLGDWRDEESGCVNLGHIAWGILAGAELVRRERGSDLWRQIEGRTHRTGQHINKGALVAVAEDGLVYAVDTVIQPALKLPIEVGKRYKLTCPFAGDEGVHEAVRYDAHSITVCEWIFDEYSGESRAGTAFRIEGPVEP